VIHHTDQGSQYKSDIYGSRLLELGTRLSMSGGGDLTVSIEIWQGFLGNDRNSLVKSNLGHGLTPERIRQKLTEAW